MAYLIRPGDRAALLRIFEMNTCLWGGMFNAIIPVYKRTPNGWSNKPLPPPKAVEIVRGYLDVFDPDFIVAMEPALAKLPGIDASRVIKPSDVFDHSRDDPIGYGISVQAVFRDLYDRSFRFESRHPRKVGLPALNGDRYALFSGAAFGRFPEHNAVSHFRKNYQEAFDANEYEVEKDSIQQFLSRKVLAPLSLGSSGLDIEPQGWNNEPALFLMDATDCRDIIHFWNHRALGRTTVPVPIQWQDDLADSCREFVLSQNVPIRNQPQFMHTTTILRGPSVSETDAGAFIKKLRLPRPGAVLIGSYPRIWEQWARERGHTDRVLIDAGQSEEDCIVEDGRIAFECHSPQFDPGFGPPASPMFANIIHLSDYSGTSELATILPPGMTGLSEILDPLVHKSTWTRAAQEGIVTLCTSRKELRFWQVPTSLTVMQNWLKSQGLDTDLSTAGRTCLQVVRRLRGLNGVRLIANKKIIELLDKMADGMVERPALEAPPTGRKPNATYRFAGWQNWWNELDGKNEERIAERTLDQLTRRSVLQIGLPIPCPHCDVQNWYALGEIQDALSCENCLQQFDFPSAHPPKDWAYRTQGPFSIDGYAHGAYCVALTLNCLQHFLGHGANCTWSPSLSVKGTDERELDFAMWCRTRREGRNEAAFVIGECKSFCKTKRQFTTRDLKRAQDLARKFSHAVFVFATLAPELHHADKQAITSFARAGRFRPNIEKWQTPVLILTGIELLNQWGPPNCWEDAGGRFTAFGKHFNRHRDLLALCDVTQQLHLGMEPYAARRQKYFERRYARKATKNQ